MDRLMIRGVLVLLILALGVGCSSKPDVAKEKVLSPEVVTDQETDILDGYDDVTRLDDELVSDSLMDEHLSDSLVIVDDEGSTDSRRQDSSRAEVVIAKAHRVFEDIYFDFDRRTPQQRMLTRLREQAEWLRNHTDAEVMVAGHCDARGSREYNMVLGEKRAQWIKTFFMKSGVNGERIDIISYGKEQPRCLKETRSCYSKNRRAQLALQ